MKFSKLPSNLVFIVRAYLVFWNKSKENLSQFSILSSYVCTIFVLVSCVWALNFNPQNPKHKKVIAQISDSMRKPTIPTRLE